MAQLPLQVINLQLHDFGILLMRKVAPASRLAPASMGGMHTNLQFPSALKINKMILTLGPHDSYKFEPELTIVGCKNHYSTRIAHRRCQL